MLKTENKSDDSDDDYELPNLLERVQASFKTQNTLQCILTSDSETEESEFSKVSKGKHSTPHSEIKYKPILFSSESEDEEFEFLKSSLKMRSAPCSKFRKAHLEESSYAEDLNGSYISNFQNRLVNHETSGSDSDKTFSNILENIRKSQTPLVPNILKSHKGSSLQDMKFSHSLQIIKDTPVPLSKMKEEIRVTESDSDESFTNIIENIRKCQTPITQNKQMLKESEPDSDGEFSNIIGKLNAIHLPMSQNKNSRNFISPISEKQEFLDASGKEAILQKSSSVRIMNKKEYAALFPSQYMHLSFEDQKVYGQKLFKFFNNKIFSSQLPADMPLIWSDSLLRTAGLTHYRYTGDGIRSCFITLSSKLLLSFDRLQDTLLHEMCHAAVWIISKGNDSHGPLWKTWASRCKLILPFVNCPERCHDYKIAYRVWYQCLNCDFKVGRCKQSRKLQRSVCKKCKTPLVMTAN